jgi:hypothetical protein
VLQNALKNIRFEDISKPNNERVPVDLRKQHKSVLYQKKMAREYCIYYMDWLKLMQLRREASFINDEEDNSCTTEEEADEIYDEKFRTEDWLI